LGLDLCGHWDHKLNAEILRPDGVVYLVVPSPPMDHEIESRQGICRVVPYIKSRNLVLATENYSTIDIYVFKDRWRLLDIPV
jgi:hypothetical protein